MKRVAVIGAGAAGLCAARHLLRVNIQPVIFEQRDCIGGQWAYEDVDRNNQKEVFSSMYDNLRTNLPKQVMSYPDFAFPENISSFMHFSDVEKYLRDYVEKFQLESYMKFNAKIISVQQISSQYCHDLGDRFVTWQIKFNFNGHVHCDIFDGVMICTGRYSAPNYPTIEGIEHFTGPILHSHYYRHPDDFKNETVLVYGAGPSGSDIMLEVAKTAKTVYLSHKRDRFVSTLPDNVKEVENVSHVTDSGEFVFVNNDTPVKIDSFIPCTGYLFKFDFLTEDCGLIVTDYIIHNLYLHSINTKYPSMVLIGLPNAVAPFPLCHQQCAYVTNIFSGVVNLPTEEQMQLATLQERSELKRKGQPDHHFHKFVSTQFEYNNKLSELSGYPPNPPIFETLYNLTKMYRKTNLQHYKNIEYYEKENGDFNVDLNHNGKVT